MTKRGDIRGADMQHIGTIQNNTASSTFGYVANAYADLYTNVRSKKIAPLRTDEVKEGAQNVSVHRNSWIVLKEDRNIVPKNTRYVVDGIAHYITNVREYMDSRVFIVLDTETRDNQ